MAENSRRWTPYNYAYNNPIFFVDPDGMQSRPMDSYGRDLLSTGGSFTFRSFSDDFMGQSNEHDPPGGKKINSSPVKETVLPEMVITANRAPKTVFEKAWDKFVNIPNDFAASLHQEALAMVPGNNSGIYGMNQHGFDAISISGNFGINMGIFNGNLTLGFAYTHGEAAVVYGGDYGLGDFTQPFKIGGGITLNGHNNFGNNTDVLDGLGGMDLNYSAGYGVMGTYGVSAVEQGNKTKHAGSGVETYGIGMGTGLSISKSHAKVYRAKDLRRDYSRFKNTILQAITPP